MATLSCHASDVVEMSFEQTTKPALSRLLTLACLCLQVPQQDGHPLTCSRRGGDVSSADHCTSPLTSLNPLTAGTPAQWPACHVVLATRWRRHLSTPLHLPSHVSPPSACRYPSTVATLSRRARDVVEASFELTSDGGRDSPLVPSRLHDFGFRGCTTPEQSIVGGCAHLLNFQGSDTMSAAYYAQVRLVQCRPNLRPITCCCWSVQLCQKPAACELPVMPKCDCLI